MVHKTEPTQFKKAQHSAELPKRIYERRANIGGYTFINVPLKINASVLSTHELTILKRRHYYLLVRFALLYVANI